MKREELKMITNEIDKLSECFPNSEILFEGESIFLKPKSDCLFYIRITYGKDQENNNGFLVSLNVPLNAKRNKEDGKIENIVGELSIRNDFVKSDTDIPGANTLKIVMLLMDFLTTEVNKITSVLSSPL